MLAIDAPSALTPKPFDIGPKGLIVNGAPTFEQWRAFGDTLRGIKNAVQWAVGDWINYGETHYGEKYAQALDETKYAYGTLRNYASVAERVDLSHRVTSLSWSHHAAVAALPPEKQTEVLLEAQHKRLGRDDVKALVDQKRSKPAPPPAAPRTVTATFEATYSTQHDVMLKDKQTAFEFMKVCSAHPDATITVTVTYTDDARR